MASASTAPRPKRRQSGAFGVAVGVTFAIAAVVVIAASGHEQPAQAPPDPAARLLSEVRHAGGVDRVSVSDGTLLVDATVHPQDALFYMTEALDVVRGIANRIHRLPGDQVHPGAVRITVSGPAVDRLGHSSVDPFIVMQFPFDDLRDADFGNLTFGGQADLTQSYELENVAGLEAVRSFCTDPLRGADSSAFCPDVAKHHRLFGL